MGEASAGELHLRVRGLVKRFASVDVLRSLDLNVPSGSVYAFLGRNGAGKTTTLQVVMGILRPDAGELRFFGQSFARTPSEIKQRIGYVAQEQHFYPWMSCARLAAFVRPFYPNWDQAEFERLCQVFDLPATRKVAELSGGMRVKLALVLALAHRPDLLILDEPTSGLDPVARQEFLEAITLQAERSGRTTLFSTHRIEEVEEAGDTVGILNRGELAYEGPIGRLTESVRAVPVEASEAAGWQAPAGFEHVRERRDDAGLEVILRAPPETWATSPIEDRSRRLSLEEIFIATTRDDLRRL